jgi:PAS domain S-box-containing protein
LSERSKLFQIISTAAAVIVAALVAILLMGIATSKANSELLRNRILIERLHETLSSLKDAETGQRGFLLTGDENYLKPYNQGVAQAQGQLKNLAYRARAGELSSDEVNQLTSLADQKLDELKQTIGLRRTQGLPAALAVVETARGKDLMDQIRVQVARMTALADSRLATAHERVEGFVEFTRIVIGLSTLVTIMVLVWAYRRISEESRARELAALDLLRQKELLAVTLASIGDAVIVTDVAGRITFLNEVAEQLTGWRAGEAHGRPCSEIFHIINEESRQAVESPVEKVLRLGTVTGLANHTLLIRKDGAELPIDDSGSPIREGSGATRGAVLVFRDFSEHKASEKRLVETNRALQNANQAKDRFLAILSHELRTPLTPVLATLTTWETNNELPPLLLPDVQMMRRNVELEAHLIDDLLDVNRIVKGKLTLNLELVDLHELVRAVVRMLQSEINAKQLNIALNFGAARYYVKGDSARLQQVLGNILNNAAKFTGHDGHIAITSGDDVHGRIVLTFKDDGIGMTPEVLSGLFKPFEQGVDISNRFGGLGLGMTIAKALVDMHAGVLTAQSEGPGCGSAFTISLPSIQASTIKLSPPGTGAAGGRRTPQDVAILLVEDHQDSAEVVSRLLRIKGYEVETCGTVAEAEKAMDARQFNLLLSDIGLPDGSGVDLIRRVRQRSTIPAIALTGFGMDSDIASYREAGFDAHLTKPINFQKLEMIINQFFQ